MKRMLSKIVLITLFFSAAITFPMESNNSVLPSIVLPVSQSVSFLKPKSLFGKIAFTVAVTAVSSFACNFIWRTINKKEILNKDFLSAIEKEDLGEIKRLLEKGANVNEQEIIIGQIVGKTALMKAVDKGNLEMVQLLLEKGADVNVQGKSGLTALMIAVSNGHLEIVKLLLENHANIDLQDMLNETALGKATKKGYLEITQLLNENINK